MAHTPLRISFLSICAANLRVAGVVLVLMAAASPIAFGQSGSDNEVFELPRVTGDITLDGRIDEAAWEAIDALPVVMYEPVYQGQMTERSELRVGYDDQFLYAAARMYDSDPDNIRANSMYRDRYSGDDAFSVILDTFNDRQNAVWFATNPNGVRMDYAITQDLEFFGSDPFGQVVSDSWNTFWDVATHRTHEGWFAELRIPLSSLGFQDQDGIVEMGMSVFRRIARKNEMHSFPSVPPNWNMAFAKPSQLARVRLTNVQASTPLYITPYAAGGGTQTNELQEGGNAYTLERTLSGDIGLDAKYNVTSNLTLDVTLNTDFAQAEVDDEQVNLTRFSLFFPEKRQFFQERAGIFEFRTAGRFDRIFNTRQIGLNDGKAVPIIGGARLTGRAGGWDIGALNLQTARFEGIPSENFGVYRLRKQVFNPNSFIGGIVTTRIDEDKAWNVVYGLDGIIKIAPLQYLELKWAQTFADDIEDKSLRSNGYGRARLERRTRIGLNYILSAAWGGESFNPGIGFVSRTGFIQPFFTVGYGWLASESSSILSTQPRILFSQYLRDEDGSLESAMYWLDWEVAMKSGTVLTLTAQAYTEDLREPVSFPEDTEVPVGKYNYYALQAEYIGPDGNLIRTDGTASFGSFFDGTNLEVQLEPSWYVSRNLEIGATYQFNYVRFPDRDQEFIVNLARLRFQIGFTTRISINAFLQYNTDADAFSSNMRFRYNFREGNDLWIVYNEGRHTNRFNFDPALPSLDNRTLLLKYTYTFIR